MFYKFLADFIIVLHLTFILFVLFGALFVLKKPKLSWVHIPAAVWGMLISLVGWICPLTPLENYFRRIAGAQGYAGSFIDHYIMPIIYPSGLTRELAIGIGVFVLLWNGLFYSILVYKIKRKRRRH